MRLNASIAFVVVALVAAPASAQEFRWPRDGLVQPPLQRGSKSVLICFEQFEWSSTSNLFTASRDGVIAVSRAAETNVASGKYTLVVRHEAGYDTVYEWATAPGFGAPPAGEPALQGPDLAGTLFDGDLSFSIRRFGAKLFIPLAGEVRRGRAIPFKYPGLRRPIDATLEPATSSTPERLRVSVLDVREIAARKRGERARLVPCLKQGRPWYAFFLPDAKVQGFEKGDAPDGSADATWDGWRWTFTFGSAKRPLAQGSYHVDVEISRTDASGKKVSDVTLSGPFTH